MATLESIEQYRWKKECEEMSNAQIEDLISRSLEMTMKLHRHLNFFEDTYPALYEKVVRELEGGNV